MGDDEKAALAEKQLGNEAYKKKDFDTAIKHYSKVGILSLNISTSYTQSPFLRDTADSD